jgi:flagellar operon protein
MTDRITIIPQPLVPTRSRPTASRGTAAVGGNFEQLLQNKIGQSRIKFSRHAAERMSTRGIEFDSMQIQRLETAVSQVNAKGGRESLVLLDDTALVVSVKNDTVVTVVDKQQLNNNVFTNIDSAVIA